MDLKIQAIQKALKVTPGAEIEMMNRAMKLKTDLDDLLFTLEGPSAKASWEELPPMVMPLNRRMNVMIRTHWSSTSELTKTEKDQLEILKEEFPPLLDQLKEIVGEIKALDQELEAIKAPWTPGRLPVLGT